ncbi:MAG TPA: ribonuclease PH, partial [Acidimicrobiales bacterium]|nr:ribonuclease PH [Acidimicrobiales bacterium]
MDAPVTRADGRAADQARPLTFERDFTQMADGSVLVSVGRTRVLCTASVTDDVPRWLRGSGRGWVTAEYSMLPGSSSERVAREAARGRQSGRTHEIQRLIGRSLRAVTRLEAMADLQVTVDCDVIQADGGTRCAAITGGLVALHDAMTRVVDSGRLAVNPVADVVAAVSVGVVDGAAVLDLPYEEDSRAETDMNVVMTGGGQFVEVQGTAEGQPFGRGELDAMLDLAVGGLGD